MVYFQFTTYVLRSQTNDVFSFPRTPLSKSTFTYKRTPSECLTSGEPQRKITWNQAIKFLYQQAATHRYDPTFDYLQVLTVGCDKDTRIPLSVDALFPG